VLLQANLWYKQHRYEEARSEALHGVGMFEKLGAVSDVEFCRQLLQWIEEETGELVTSDESDSNGGLPEVVPPPTSTNSPLLVHGTEQ
jgi:hypothetical protein